MKERVKKYWWVALFLLGLCGTYTHAAAKRQAVYLSLESEVNRLKAEIEDAKALQEELELAVASHSDPDWVGLMLMKGLGVVPEGQIKIHFE